MVLVIPLFLSLILIYVAYSFSKIKQLFKNWAYGHKIPGPRPHPIFGNIVQLLNVTTEDFPVVLRQWAKEQTDNGNSIMRAHMMGTLNIWPLDGKSMAPILDSTTEIDKGSDYAFLNPWLEGGILFEGYGERWRSHRKLLTPSFHFAKLEGYMEVFNSESTILIECLEGFAESGDPVDLFPYIKRCALDIICATAMGVKVDAQYNHDTPYTNAVEGITKLGVDYSLKPALQIPILFRLLGYQAQFDEYLRILKGFTRKVIDERKASIESGEIEKETTKRRMNFLDLLLNMEDSNQLTAEDIRQEVDTFMFAGHDTTTASTSWACWNLAHNPEIQEKVYEEVMSAVGNDTQITTEHLSKMPFLDRVLKESKRLIPPVPNAQRLLRNDMIIDGHLLPAGSNVNITPIILHHNPKVFPNPTKFDPDRFLPEEVARRHPYDYIPFSAGLRNCIGQKFAQLNEKVLIIQLIRNFRIVSQKPFDFTKPCVEVVTKPSNGIPVELIKRDFA